MSRAKRPVRFTDINQACLAKMPGCGVQEELNTPSDRSVRSSLDSHKSLNFYLPITRSVTSSISIKV